MRKNTLNDFIFDEEIISKGLLDYDSDSRLCLEDERFTKGAVVFLLIANHNKPYDLVLIRRTHRDGDKHSGEMSFPGGKFEEKKDKTFIDTALRETEEELGIARNNINVLGSFDDHITPKFFIISPIVGYISPDQKMVKQESEVKEIVKIPISFFANKKNYRERTYMLHGNKIAVGKYVYRNSGGKKYVIFGATTHIIVHFLTQIYGMQLMRPGYRRLNCSDFRERMRRNYK
ncbi:MAG: NUDIX domain-containing protein [Candidatus Lokiarchaeota archaeon]|nr:NUDIX domain-containing protein [Candidatus Lokiarchaeota archaeon]